MNEKELQEFKAALERRLEEVKASPDAARALLNRLGMLTPEGDLKDCYKP